MQMEAVYQFILLEGLFLLVIAIFLTMKKIRRSLGKKIAVLISVMYTICEVPKLDA